MIAEKQDIDNRKFKLISEYEESREYFGEAYTYILNFIKLLWNEPKLVSKLLINSDLKDVKKNLAPFFINNFYENILSSVYMEDNLMYLISLILIEEIKGLKKENYNNFLEETAGGYVLEQLKNKTDVQNYFKAIIFNLVEQLETISGSKKIAFNVQQMQDDLSQEKELMEKNIQKSGMKQKIVDKDFFKKNVNLDSISEEADAFSFQDNYLNESIKDNKQKKLFNTKYIPDITKGDLEDIIKENEGNKGMKEYCDLQIKKLKNNSKFISNDKFLAKVLSLKDSSDVLALYQIDFFKVIKIIDGLFDNLINNIYLIPYSVKCICKIILTLIKKGNPKISIMEQNKLISRFFFYKLFLPVFRNPGYGALINNFIISGTTIHNLDIIAKVIEQLILGNLINYDDINSDLSPFNLYFLGKMPMALKFFESLTKVTLPPFIEKLINGNLPNNFVFNYFKENPEEVVFHRSICFSTDDLLVLLSNMEKCKNKLFNNGKSDLELTFNEITSEDGESKEAIESLRNTEEYETINNEKKKKEIKGKKILNYFLFTDLLVNNKYKKLFGFQQIRPNFTLEEKTTTMPTENEGDKQNNNIIKVKNFISSLLYNYRSLVKTDFDEGTTQNTIKILRELKKFMKTSNFVIDGTIPSEWYVNSLIDRLNFLPADFQSNDFENLFKSLENDVSNSIKEIDFETMSVYLGKVKFAQRGKIYYENAKKSIIDLELNEKVQSIIEKEPISSIIFLKYTEKEKEFKIEKGKALKEVPALEIFRDNNEKKKICPSIESFAYKFPNISKIQQLQDIDLFQLDKELNFSNELLNYFKLIKEYLIKYLKFDENSQEFEDVNNKIFDYVMEKIYEKIYPLEPDETDNRIYKNCVLLSWIEPKHIFEEKNNYYNYIFDNFLPDVFASFNKIEKEKSPRKKMLSMSEIFVSIENVVKFNGDNQDLGVDGNHPFLKYGFIKSHPLNINKNCKFMDLFLGSKRDKDEGIQLAQLQAICQIVDEMECS